MLVAEQALIVVINAIKYHVNYMIYRLGKYIVFTSNTTTILSSSFTKMAIYDFICQKLMPSLIITSSILFLLMNRETEEPPQYVVLTCIPTSRIDNILSNHFPC